MALVVESTSITSGYGTTAVITKPTGLQEGELLIALLEANANAGTTINTASGWTSVGSSTQSYSCVNIQYKIASAGDVAASNFTFTDSAGSRIGGGLLRVSGNPATSNVADFETDTYDSTATTSVSFATSLTPVVANSLVVAVIGAGQGSASGVGTMSNYASTPSVSFTELFDQGVELGNNVDTQGAGIYGFHTSAAEITAYSSTLSASKARHVGIIAVFSPQVNATASNALFQTSPVTFSPLTGSTQNATNHYILTSPEFPTQSARGTSPTQWTNEAITTTEWVNETL